MCKDIRVYMIHSFRRLTGSLTDPALLRKETGFLAEISWGLRYKGCYKEVEEE